MNYRLDTRREMKEEMDMTRKQPNEESAMIAPMTGKRLVQPLTTLLIWVAWILFTLYSCIRYIIRFPIHPPTASVSPVIVAGFDHRKKNKIE